MFGDFTRTGAAATVIKQDNSTAISPAELARQVQHNCHIADANHGADYTLCIYLMKMREYYRWEMDRPFTDLLGKDEVGEWLVQREALWDSLDGAEFKPLKLAGEDLQPFDTDRINDLLLDDGLVYGGGLGRSGRPHFFLAEIRQRQAEEEWSLVVTGRELARDLTSPPAMTQGHTIIIRRESLQRMLWERLENWRWSSPDNAMGRALACYDFDNELEGSLARMTDVEADAVLWHEIGEIRAGDLLGAGWEPMLADLLFSPAELMCRAVRDHLADCLMTLPRLLERVEEPSLHFFFGNLSHMRKAIFPSLQAAYDDWHRGEGLGTLRQAGENGLEHWRQLSERILDLHRQRGEESAKAIAALVETSHL